MVGDIGSPSVIFISPRMGTPLYLPPRPLHHLESLPIPAEEAEGHRTHDISNQDLQAPGPVHGVLRLEQVQEYHVKDLLPHGHNLLEKFDLKVGGHCTVTMLKSSDLEY